MWKSKEAMLKEEYKKELLHQLNKIITKYEKRLQKKKGKYEHLGDKKAFVMTAATVAGGAAGTVMPGVGNVAGAALGAGVGLFILAVMKVHYKRMLKHIDNAINAMSSLESVKETREELLKAVVYKVVEDRGEQLSHLKDGKVSGYYNRKSVAKYLAANMMTALKNHHEEHPKQDITQHEVETIMTKEAEAKLSKKIHSLPLFTKDHEHFSSRSFAKLRPSP